MQRQGRRIEAPLVSYYCGVFFSLYFSSKNYSFLCVRVFTKFLDGENFYILV